jgi:hypothetical protein
MTINGKNYANIPASTLDSVLSQDTYVKCIFSMTSPDDNGNDKIGHLLLSSDDGAGFIFKDCIFINRKPPDNAVYVGLNQAILMEHQTPTVYDSVTIDGITKTIQNYAHILYGRYVNGQYEYEDPPLEIPCEGP